MSVRAVALDIAAAEIERALESLSDRWQGTTVWVERLEAFCSIADMAAKRSRVAADCLREAHRFIHGIGCPPPDQHFELFARTTRHFLEREWIRHLSSSLRMREQKRQFQAAALADARVFEALDAVCRDDASRVD